MVKVIMSLVVNELFARSGIFNTFAFFLVFLTFTNPLEAQNKIGFVNEIGMKMKFIPAQEMRFQRTDPILTEINFPTKFHLINIKSFYVCKHETTLRQFEQFLAACPDYRKRIESQERVNYKFTWDKGVHVIQSKCGWRNCGFAQTGDHPVLNVRVEDALAFCKWLSKESGKNYRLPTEEEWCLFAGCNLNRLRYFVPIEQFGELDSLYPQYENIGGQECVDYLENTHLEVDLEGDSDTYYLTTVPHNACRAQWKNDNFVFTAPVGSFKPNAFGIFDTLGNVREMCIRSPLLECEDSLLLKKVFKVSVKDFPYLVRGGAWCDSDKASTIAIRRTIALTERGSEFPLNRNSLAVGFRVVCDDFDSNSQTLHAQTLSDKDNSQTGHLKKYAGSWNCAGKIWLTPTSKKAATFEGVATGELHGNWLFLKYEVAGFSNHLYISYNPISKQYEGYCITGPNPFVAKYSGNISDKKDKLEFSVKAQNAVSGEEYEDKEVLKIVDENTWQLTTFSKNDENGSYWKNMELEFTRSH